MPDLPAMLTVAQVAAMLQVSKRWVREMCGCDRIRAVRLNGKGPYRIYPDGLSRVLKGQLSPAPKAGATKL